MAIKDNHRTILHQMWTCEYFYPNSSLAKTRVISAIIPYVMGMIGYTLDSIIKTVLAIGNTCILLIALCRREKNWRNERAVICLDTWAALGIAIIGVLIPPLAYRLDAACQERILNFQSHLIQYSP